VRGHAFLLADELCKGLFQQAEILGGVEARFRAAMWKSVRREYRRDAILKYNTH
jgi:hypothetical protein